MCQRLWQQTPPQETSFVYHEAISHDQPTVVHNSISLVTHIDSLLSDTKTSSSTVYREIASFKENETKACHMLPNCKSSKKWLWLGLTAERRLFKETSEACLLSCAVYTNTHSAPKPVWRLRVVEQVQPSRFLCLISPVAWLFIVEKMEDGMYYFRGGLYNFFNVYDLSQLSVWQVHPSGSSCRKANCSLNFSQDQYSQS